jgi:hypothetical protein
MTLTIVQEHETTDDSSILLDDETSMISLLAKPPLPVDDWHWDEDQRRALGVSHRRTMEELETKSVDCLSSSICINEPMPEPAKQREKTSFHPLMGILSKEEIKEQENQERKQSAKQEPFKRGFIWHLIERWMPKFFLIKMQPADEATPKSGPQPFPFHFKPPVFKNPFRPRPNTQVQRRQGHQPPPPPPPTLSPRRLPPQKPSWLARFTTRSSVDEERRHALQQVNALRDSTHDFSTTRQNSR